ncbi:hypothetical protein LguiB_020073 [Lonicera macranthoides]
MRKLCPNYDKENGLDTVLEVPIPEEMFTSMGSNMAARWQTLLNKMRAHTGTGSRDDHQFMLLLKIVGSPLIPLQAQLDYAVNTTVRDGTIVSVTYIHIASYTQLFIREIFEIEHLYEQEASTAKYIVQQYVAATGGQAVLNSVSSMYAVGQVKLVQSEIHQSSDDSMNAKRSSEIGGFVLWQKNPDLWYLELVVSRCKVSAGSDGKVAWSQTSSNPSAPSKGPPRPLRRFFQGLDPRSTSNLFLNAVCIGEKTIKDEDCFILRLETGSDILKAQSTPHTEIVHHTIWGYFSQRTGLLLQFEDTKLVRMKASKGDTSVFWETSMESILEDYMYVDGINIAHSGKTTATMYRYGHALNHRGKIEETWRLEEVDFNIIGLSMDSFLPPADIKRDLGNEDSGLGC